jgi:NADH-quinone oxidoreductase subunit L
MVTAGVYLVVRCNGLFQNAPTAMFIVAIIGCATAFFAATIGLAQNDIKKVLAYSTVSQLGYMFLACGVGAFIAAIFHVMTHAFFKALLFLGSGSVIHGMHHEQDMRKMGNLRKYMPVTFVTMMMGWLAICGIPIWAGFFSKDEILYKTFAAQNIPEPWNYVLWGFGVLTAVMTAIYMTRMMWMTFFGTERFHDAIEGEEHGHGDVATQGHGDETAHHDAHDSHDDDEDDHHHALPHDFKPHESPWSMKGPLIALALLSTFGGLLGVPYALSGGAIPNVIEHTLEPIIVKVGKKNTGPEHFPNEKPAADSKEVKYFLAAEKPAGAGTDSTYDPHSPEVILKERLLAGLSVLLALSGIAIGIALFGKTPLRKMPKILEDKWRIDELYNGYIVDPITRFSRERLWKGFDVGFIDGVVNGIGHAVMQIGNLVRGVQVGYVRSYAAIIVIGALVVVAYFVYYGLKLVG